MNTDANALPENRDDRLNTESQLRAFGDAEKNKLKIAVNIATTGEIIKSAISDVFVEEANPTVTEIIRYIVIESNKD